MGAFKLVKTKSGKFTYRLVASNGQIILSGDLYGSRKAAESAIKTVSEFAQTDNNFERRDTARGEYYFVLKDFNGRVIGKSEPYASQAGRENGIWSVKRNAAVPLALDE